MKAAGAFGMTFDRVAELGRKSTSSARVTFRRDQVSTSSSGFEKLSRRIFFIIIIISFFLSYRETPDASHKGGEAELHGGTKINPEH